MRPQFSIKGTVFDGNDISMHHFKDKEDIIYIFDNRVEIVSPGNLPNTITEENIKYGVHIERNPTILSFLEKDPWFSYSGRGSGIPSVLKMCNQAGVKVEFLDDKQKQQCILNLFFYIWL
jgi:ATP-dependent DNA helicase RecG